MKMLTKTIIKPFLLLVLFSVGLSAQTVNLNTGNFVSQLNNISSNTTYVLANGTYTLSSSNLDTWRNNMQNNVTFRGASSTGVTIVFNGSNMDELRFNSRSNVVLENLKFKNIKITFDDCTSSKIRGVQMSDPSYSSLGDKKSFDRKFIQITDGSNNEVSNCTLNWNNSTQGKFGRGIKLTGGSNSKIVNCNITGFLIGAVGVSTNRNDNSSANQAVNPRTDHQIIGGTYTRSSNAGTANAHEDHGIYIHNASHVTVDGVTVGGWSTEGSGHAIKIKGANFIDIKNCTFNTSGIIIRVADNWHDANDHIWIHDNVFNDYGVNSWTNFDDNATINHSCVIENNDIRSGNVKALTENATSFNKFNNLAGKNGGVFNNCVNTANELKSGINNSNNNSSACDLSGGGGGGGGGGGCTATAVTPYLQVNGAAWQQTTTASLSVGDDLRFGPQPTNGSWSWTGPNGYSSSAREATVNNIQTNQAGNYSATYTDGNGCTSSATFSISVAGSSGGGGGMTSGVPVNGSLSNSSTRVIHYIDIGSGATNLAATLSHDGGADFDLYGKAGSEPNPTTSSGACSGCSIIAYTTNNPETGSVSNPAQGRYYFAVDRYGTVNGNYTLTATVTYSSGGGGGGCSATAVTPYLQINGAAWQQTTTASLSVGDDLRFGPQPTNGSWSWTGPNGYSSSAREATVNNIQTNQAGNYIATYTDGNGCTSSATFSISVSGSSGGAGGLTSGSPVTGSLSTSNTRDIHFIDIAGGATNISLTLSMPSGADFDLYGKAGSEPSPDGNGGCSGCGIIRWTEDNPETGSESNPPAGRYYIAVEHYDGSGQYTLTATVTYGGASADIGIDGESQVPYQHESIQIYPNPVGKGLELNVEFPTGFDEENVTIDVINLSGQVVRSQKYNLPASRIRLSTIGLSSGMYLVKIHGIADPFVRRVVLK